MLRLMVIVAVALTAGAIIWLFNRMVRLRQRMAGAFSDIDVQLKRRWDLVPGLVATVQGYAAHEKDTLERTTAARQRAAEAGSGSPASRGVEEGHLAGAVRMLFAVAEDYPDLKANETFNQLHRSLVEIEEALQCARRYYNAVVRDYNTLIATFPANLAARAFRFGQAEFFQIEDDQRAAPQVAMSRSGDQQ